MQAVRGRLSRCYRRHIPILDGREAFFCGIRANVAMLCSGILDSDISAGRIRAETSGLRFRSAPQYRCTRDLQALHRCRDLAEGRALDHVVYPPAPAPNASVFPV